MTTIHRALRKAGALLLTAGALACGQGGEEGADARATPAEGAGPMDGMTREQIQQSAEAMSPEQAEALGIVDTTITVENPPAYDPASPSPVAPPAADTIP